MNEIKSVSAEDEQDYIYLSFPNLIRDRRFLRLLALGWVLCIALGVILRDSLPKTTGVLHVVIHLAVFTILGTLISLSFETASLRLAFVFLGGALGCGSELYEHLVLHAPLEYQDILFDLLGVALGWAGAALKRVASMPAST